LGETLDAAPHSGLAQGRTSDTKPASILRKEQDSHPRSPASRGPFRDCPIVRGIPAPGGAARLRREIWPRRDPCRPGFIALTGRDLPIGQWDGRLRKPMRQADYLAHRVERLGEMGDEGRARRNSVCGQCATAGEEDVSNTAVNQHRTGTPLQSGLPA
jgi:hypothetical protein